MRASTAVKAGTARGDAGRRGHYFLSPVGLRLALNSSATALPDLTPIMKVAAMGVQRMFGWPLSGDGDFHFGEFDADFIEADAGGTDADDFATEMTDAAVGQRQLHFDLLAGVDEGFVDEGEAGAGEVAGGDVEAVGFVTAGGGVDDAGTDAVAAAAGVSAFGVGGRAALFIKPFEGVLDRVGHGDGCGGC